MLSSLYLRLKTSGMTLFFFQLSITDYGFTPPILVFKDKGRRKEYIIFMEIGACLSAKGCIVSKCNVCCTEYLLSLQNIVSSRCLVICTDTEFCNIRCCRAHVENVFKILYKFMVTFSI